MRTSARHLDCSIITPTTAYLTLGRRSPAIGSAIAIIRQMVMPFVAVGDGNNDAEMIEAAEVGVGFGGVRPIAPSVLECATHAVYSEKALVRLLNKLI